MRVVIVPSLHKPLAEEMVPHLITLVKKQGAAVFRINELVSPEKTPIDLIISVGGDGTLIQAYHRLIAYKAPIIGINLGHLGFLADIPIEKTPYHLKEILQGRFKVEKRTMLKILWENKTFACINDLVIHRGQSEGLASIKVAVDHQWLNTFRADGMVVATATGSTAYALATGGPILSPTMQASVITPICPHTISNRPIVLDSFKTMTLSCIESSSPVTMYADGVAIGKLSENQQVEVGYHTTPLLLAHTTDYDFYAIVRSKLGWSGGHTHPASLTAFFQNEE